MGGENFKPGEVIVWDAVSGQPIHTLKGHTRKVSSVAFSHDGKRIASGGEGGPMSRALVRRRAARVVPPTTQH